jgi:hypothetical protein
MVLLVLGCAEDPTTPDAVRYGGEAPDLDLIWPALTLESRTPTEVVELPGDPRPPGVIRDDYDDSAPPENVSATIIGPITQVGFTPTYAYSRGRHSYTGNVGKVTTEARVTFDGQSIGMQPAMRQKSVPFLLDWGEVKSISVEAYVFTDQDCGLRVDGSSKHYAWWSWFLGGPTPDWGDAIASSQAFPPATLPPCAPEPIPDPEYPNSDGSGTDGGGGGSVTCWYWVTFDPYTGEVTDQQFLFCEGIDGG